MGAKGEAGQVSRTAVEKGGKGAAADKDHLGGVCWLIKVGWEMDKLKNNKNKRKLCPQDDQSALSFQTGKRQTGGEGRQWRQGRQVAENRSWKAMSLRNVAKPGMSSWEFRHGNPDQKTPG